MVEHSSVHSVKGSAKMSKEFLLPSAIIVFLLGVLIGMFVEVVLLQVQGQLKK